MSKETIEIDTEAAYPISQEDCEEYFGHCHKMSSKVLLSYPAKEERVCKLCGHTQRRKQGPRPWKDVGD